MKCLHDLRIAGHNVNKKKIEISPFNYGDLTEKWENANLYPLNGALNIFQILRFMILTGHYYFSSKWVATQNS